MWWIFLYFFIGTCTIPAVFYADYLMDGQTQWTLGEVVGNTLGAFFLWWLLWCIAPFIILEKNKYKVVLDINKLRADKGEGDDQ